MKYKSKKMEKYDKSLSSTRESVIGIIASKYDNISLFHLVIN